MGVILNFPIERARARCADRPCASPGSVIILPVVRIERHVDHWAQLTPQARPSTQAPKRSGRRSPRASKPNGS